MTCVEGYMAAYEAISGISLPGLKTLLSLAGCVYASVIDQLFDFTLWRRGLGGAAATFQQPPGQAAKGVRIRYEKYQVWNAAMAAWAPGLPWPGLPPVRG